MGKRPVSLDNTTILVTGAAGFIGASLCVRLLESAANSRIVGLDNLSTYYSPVLKRARLDWVEKTAASSSSTWEFVEGSISDAGTLGNLFSAVHPSIVVNLAAQAGVRYSIDHPDEYIETNIVGFYNILEACRRNPVEHLVYASSSSVYGGNKKVPFSTDDRTDRPVSLYAATKKSDELLAHAYSSLYSIPATGLRFFTVYGPYGRPDMFVYTACEKILAGETVQLFGEGLCKRDFTYIDDIVEGIVRVMRGAPNSEDAAPAAPHAVYNIGGGNPELVIDMVSILQEELVRCGALSESYDAGAHRQLLGMQPGDVPLTYADTVALERDYGFTPQVCLREGIRYFVTWYVGYRDLESKERSL